MLDLKKDNLDIYPFTNGVFDRGTSDFDRIKLQRLKR